MHRGGGDRRFPRHRRCRGLSGGRRLRTGRGRPRRGCRRPLRAPPGAPGDGDRGSGRQAGRVGRHRQRAAQFRRAVGRRRRHVRPATWRRTRQPTQPTRAVSIPRRAPRARFRRPGDRLDPWASVRAAVNHHTPGSAVSARAAFAAATRGGWRAERCPRRHDRDPGARRARLVRGVGRRGPGCQRTSRRRPALVDRSALPGARVTAPGPGRRRYRVAVEPCIGALSSMARRIRRETA